ncbi:MAG: hypothetical protein K0S07_1618, partial [Chlamydiales bacterium]|nr:hypothetical protein [Chlamydiales bacterium]
MPILYLLLCFSVAPLSATDQKGAEENLHTQAIKLPELTPLDTSQWVRHTFGSWEIAPTESFDRETLEVLLPPGAFLTLENDGKQTFLVATDPDGMIFRIFIKPY